MRREKFGRAGLIVVLGLGFLTVAARAEGPSPLTMAEKSQFKATSRHADVVAFCEELAKKSPLVRLGELGKSGEGRSLPLIILADPPIASAAEAAKSGKLIVYAEGNIHAGEVDGKEGLLMLARDLATGKDQRLLKEVIVVLAPIFNADGNERMNKNNRLNQAGPEEGMGVRVNAQGLDLNRDFVKLESPEVRALVHFFSEWQPAVFIDCHTTNGSFHRYLITYEGPRIAAGNPDIIRFTDQELFPDVGRRLKQHTGFDSYYYGNFSADRRSWETVDPTARYGTLYAGLRNCIGILSESYSYAPYRDRIIASREFVRSIIEYVADNKDKVHKILTRARDATVQAGSQPNPNDQVPVRTKPAPQGRPHRLLGYVEERRDGKRVRTDQFQEYEVTYMGGTTPTLSVVRPYAYLFPPALGRVVENLQRHGIEVDELREDIELDVEAYRIDKIERAFPFQKHVPENLTATARKEVRRVPAGTVLVRTGQPLGNLVVNLLEPASADGLATWNFFDESLKEGGDFPVCRLPRPQPLVTRHVRPLAEYRKRNQPITFDSLHGKGPHINLGGSPITIGAWLEDGEHYLQAKEGRLYKVHARTGRAQPFHDPDVLARALGALPTIGNDTAKAMAHRTQFVMNPSRTGALFEHENDLYFATFDGTKAVRLTRTPGREELVSFSPDGQFVAFVREQNLYVVDLATQTERALTTDGGGVISNGKADWVYFEEIFYRTEQAYWWSPDSKRIAFLRFDDTPVHRFAVTDSIPTRQSVETTPYPKAGDPNPMVKLGNVAVAGGPIHWADTSGYSETASLLVRAGWTPDSQQMFLYVQDRAQTWLDFCLVARDGGLPTRLFRETTKAWVDDPGDPKYLKDGSFLLTSERTGWKHLYHFDAKGKLLSPVTSGSWELSSGLFVPDAVQHIDEKNGWVYFLATKDSPLAANLYRVKLDGTHMERLTRERGDHHIRVSPKGEFFVDSWSHFAAPAQVRLCDASGSAVRTLDTNPVYEIEEYRLGTAELVKIPMPDGFVLEGSLFKPPDFDPQRKYPVWFMTYGGPHAPMITDAWQGGHLNDRMLTQLGFLVFHADPRSASRQGACSTWTAYRQLGVQELKDIEAAIGWLARFPFVDAARIGMSGHSYGGFMTSYALTHSKLFAAGVAGAPVTDWHNYDSIYTERYMNTPQENPDGYAKTSVVKAAKDLHGRLLILHGVMDDNVHMQNSLQLIQELQQTEKPFEVMVYPRSRHGIFGRHHQWIIVDFMQRALGVPKEREPEPHTVVQKRAG